MGLMKKTTADAHALLLELQERTIWEIHKPHSMLDGAKSKEKKRRGEETQQVTAGAGVVSLGDVSAFSSSPGSGEDQVTEDMAHSKMYVQRPQDETEPCLLMAQQRGC